jgi:hypothetical protein
MDPDEELFREVPTAGGKKWDNTSPDPAFKKDSKDAAINCSDIKKKPVPQPTEFKTIKEKKTEEGVDLLEQQILEYDQRWREHYAAKCAKSERKRTQEWVDISWEYKKDNPECEYCGETSDIESHDILPYYLLTEDQRHDRGFLKQNLISLCIEHHHNVAHLGDSYFSEFEPRIREICEQKKQEDRKRWAEENKEELELWREKRERDAKRLEELRSYVKKLPGNKISVEKMLPDDKRKY